MRRDPCEENTCSLGKGIRLGRGNVQELDRSPLRLNEKGHRIWKAVVKPVAGKIRKKSRNIFSDRAEVIAQIDTECRR